MKQIRHILTRLLFICIIIPLWGADIYQDELEKIAKAISHQEWQQAEQSFQKLTNSQIAKAETFFWEQVEPYAPCRPSMAKILGDYHKKHHNYNKAFVFYNELLTQNPYSIETLLTCADMKAKSGKTEEALPLYEQVLIQDKNNLAANIFVGNYYYFTANRACTQLKESYQKLHSPTKMDYALYREKLSKLVLSDFAKAKKFLQQAVSVFPSTKMKEALQQIKLVEMENNQ